MSGTYYIIYAKPKNSGRKFKALDLSTGQLVDRLIYATVFKDKGEVDRTLKTLKDQNTDWEFMIRRCSPKAPSLEVDLD